MGTIPVAAPIYFVRERYVILDSDLAALFGVTTKRLNQQIRRNLNRFPDDFAFALTPEEAESLRTQLAISNSRHGGRRFLPRMFTEHGVVMAANVLNSQRAVSMSLEVVRAFVRLQKVARMDTALREKVAELERSVKGRLSHHDAEITQLFKAVEALLNEPGRAVKRIGFVP